MGLIEQRIDNIFEQYEKGNLQPIQFIEELLSTSYYKYSWQQNTAKNHIKKKLEELKIKAKTENKIALF